VRKNALTREAVQSFMKFYLKSAPEMVAEVGYVKAPDEVYTLASKRLETQRVGTLFAAGHDPSVPLVEVMRKDI
jgi:phosphate transport system substrate-binding protein